MLGQPLRRLRYWLSADSAVRLNQLSHVARHLSKIRRRSRESEIRCIVIRRTSAHCVVLLCCWFSAHHGNLHLLCVRSWGRPGSSSNLLSLPEMCPIPYVRLLAVYSHDERDPLNFQRQATIGIECQDYSTHIVFMDCSRRR